MANFDATKNCAKLHVLPQASRTLRGAAKCAVFVQRIKQTDNTSEKYLYHWLNNTQRRKLIEAKYFWEM